MKGNSQKKSFIIRYLYQFEWIDSTCIIVIINFFTKVQVIDDATQPYSHHSIQLNQAQQKIKIKNKIKLKITLSLSMSLLPTIDHKIIGIVSIEWHIRIVIFYVNRSFCMFINELGVWTCFCDSFFSILLYFALYREWTNIIGQVVWRFRIDSAAQNVQQNHIHRSSVYWCPNKVWGMSDYKQKK